MNKPYPGWSPPRRTSGGEIAAAAAIGVFVYFAINLVAAVMVVLGLGLAGSSNVVLLAGAILLGLIAFGGGGALVAQRNPWARGIGMGLMIGWALSSIVTAGLCTGVNPVMYGSLT